MKLNNCMDAWLFSASQYVQMTVKKLEEYITKHEKKEWKIPMNAEMPMKTIYHPELDVSPELDPSEASYYQSLIGIL